MWQGGRAMDKVIEKFCKGRENGLFLLASPTGFGKTYKVQEFILKNCDLDAFRDRKIFFLTTMKKNLPFETLRTRFEEAGRLDEFERMAILIDSNAETLLAGLKNRDVRRAIPSEVRNWDEYKAVESSADFINRYNYQEKSKDRIALKTAYTSIYDNFTKEQEPAFRHKTESLLRESVRSPKERLKLIENDARFQWISRLYPASLTREKRLFFMSVDKFFLGNSTLIEPTYTFYNNPIIRKGIVFIDEFDSTKERLLDQIIRQGVNERVDYLALFNRIYSTLETKQFPEALTIESESNRKRREESRGTRKPEDIVDGFRKIMDDAYQTYNLQYSYRMQDTGEKNARNFLFNDLQFHAVFEGKHTAIEIIRDGKARQNWLQLTDQAVKDEKDSVISLLSSIKGCINYYVYGCKLLALNYKYHMDEIREPGDDDYSYDDAVRSVLSEFRLSREAIRYLRQQVLSGQNMNRRYKLAEDGKLLLSRFDRSAYATGFRYYDFVDEPAHNMHSEINLYDFNESPERIMKTICENACVIGISATATLPTVLGNYDLNWLKTSLRDQYYELPEEDAHRLGEEFEHFTEKYDQVNIEVEAIRGAGTAEDVQKEFEEMFQDSELAEKICEELRNSKAQNAFDQSIFLKIMKAVRSFLTDASLRSCLCFSNKLVKNNYGKLNLELIQEATKYLAQALHIACDVKKLFVVVSTDNFESEKKRIQAELKSGEKRFVLTSYRTLGAGQNMQYEAPDDAELVSVNDYIRREMERDFDSIYLEKPTNLLMNVEPGIEIQDLMKFIYQVEFMVEVGDIARTDGMKRIREAFQVYAGSGKGIYGKGALYQTESVNNYALQVLIQAVGRICRTGKKNKTIHIMVDEECFLKYDFQRIGNRLLNPEFRAIIEKSREYHSEFKTDEEQKLLNLATNVSAKTTQLIHQFLSHGWYEDSMRYWKGLRSLLLMRPTLSADDFEKMRDFQNLYFRLPAPANAYSYTQHGDYQKQIEISFQMDMTQKVSQEEARLQELLQIPGLREYFVDNHYATEFQKNEYIMTPPLFNNIYKGALGEVVGKFILETYLDCTVEEISDQKVFEKFDAVTGDGIFLDFKFWKETDREMASTEKEKIMEKLTACGGRRAVIINIMSDTEYPITPSDDGRIVEIPYLFDGKKQALAEEIIAEIVKKGYLR